MVAGHEAGHSFGIWHQDAANFNNQLMDGGQSGLQAHLGAGPDNTVGTADDEVVTFGTDVYEPTETFTGLEEAENYISWNLSSGKIATGAKGLVWSDLDRDGIRDAGEVGVPNRRVFADLDRDGIFDTGEPSALTDSNGNYTLYLAPGQYNVAEVLPPATTQTYPLTNKNVLGIGTYDITVGLGQVVTNVNFGNSLKANTITGYKYQDLNGNGQDDKEPRLSGFIFFVDLDGDGRLDDGETADESDSNGLFIIETNDVG